MGALIALASTVWLSLGGFYIIRGSSVRRDATTGPGELIAATPLSTAQYFLVKFTSNLIVLSSMLGILAVAAAILQLARGESYAILPWVLLEPFIFIALPMMAITAALALVFDAIPVLSQGLGNIIWFFVWLVIAIGGQGAGAPLGGIGVSAMLTSMKVDMAAQGIHVPAGDFSLGLTYLDHPLRTFTWHGLDLSGGFVGGRLLLVVIALLLAVAPALWFPRFDPALVRYNRVAERVRRLAPAAGPGYAVIADSPQPAAVHSQLVAERPRPVSWSAAPAGLTGSGRSGAPIFRLVAGEWRILIQGVSMLWWIGLAVITVGALVSPTNAVTAVTLPVAWIWPILVWSRLGAQSHETRADSLLSAYPRPRMRMFAQWAAGVALTAMAGFGPLARIVAAGDGPGVAAWIGGLLFIPALALLLGELSRTQRLFQALYLLLWYALINKISAVDFMGAVTHHGHLTGPSPVIIAGLALVMVAIVVAVGSARRTPAS